jgi:spermidine/putrescine-binding protein
MRDTVGDVLKLGGSSRPPRRFDAAIAEIEGRRAGIVRVQGQQYAQDLISGSIVLSMAWSGDMVRPQGKKACATSGGRVGTSRRERVHGPGRDRLLL